MSQKKIENSGKKPAVATKRPEGPEDAAAEIVLNPQNGAILHGKNLDVQRDPASLTKLMTAYMVMKAVDEGKLKLDQLITVSNKAAQYNNNTLKVPVTGPDGATSLSQQLPAGSKLTVREALIVMMTSSANGVACALGEAAAPNKLDKNGKTIRGSERDFAREMTRVAQNDLGMKNSRFINASGLNNGGDDQKSNLSTARDMATLASRMMKDYPEYVKFVSSPAATTTVILPGNQKVTVNSPTTNHFVRDNGPGTKVAERKGYFATGPQKTGYNAAASQYVGEDGKKHSSGGIGLLTTAQNKDGVRLVSVVLGARSSDTRYAATYRNFSKSYEKMKEDPQLAAVFQTEKDVASVAVTSPKIAFADLAGKKEKGAKPARTYVAQNDESRPTNGFQRTSTRRPHNTPARAAITALHTPVATTLADAGGFVDVGGLRAAGHEPQIVDHEPAAQPAVYRPPALE